ncbi:MAG: dihydrolipoamide acetyltransferase family protein [Bacteroidota bacterium]
MAKFELKLPRMGESVAEATLTTWLKEVGDVVEMDDPVFEIATDKVDSEVPCEVEGVLVEQRFAIDDVIKVGDIVAIIEVNGTSGESAQIVPEVVLPKEPVKENVSETTLSKVEETLSVAHETAHPPMPTMDSGRFYSPLVRNIAKEEGISQKELDAISGSGAEGRVTKNDILAYLSQRKNKPPKTEREGMEQVSASRAGIPDKESLQTVSTPQAPPNHTQEVIPLSRMGKLIAQHMVDSVSTSAHVQSFIEVDVTNIVNWRNKVKIQFQEREGEKLTFTPIFLEAVAKALKAYPLMNISVAGDTIIRKKNINIGMAAALPDGNLIVPVIKNADQLNLVGMAKAVNDLAQRARHSELKPDEIRDGTYTVTNVGTFGSVFGTPIINQPQVGILALGAIRKLPSVIETPEGDFIGIRSKMYLSHSYDHRVVNGALGSLFAKTVADYLEAWDMDREV